MRRLPLLVALAGLAFTPAFAATTLSPADPQPAASDLAPGLAVQYAYPPDVKTLENAGYWLDRMAKAGPPLTGLQYHDTTDNALTSSQVTRVAAKIDGFVHFEKAGAYKLKFFSNDGLDVKLGGAEIYRDDTRHPCGSDGAVEVSVPKPGWYPLHMIYFQRLESSCLIMSWQPPGGKMGEAPNAAFAYRK